MTLQRKICRLVRRTTNRAFRQRVAGFNNLRTLTPLFDEEINHRERDSMILLRQSFIPPISKIDQLKPRITGFSELSKHLYKFNPLENNEHDYSKIENQKGAIFFHKYFKPPTIKTKKTEESDNFPTKISQIPLSESIVIEDNYDSSNKKRSPRGIIANELKSFLGFLVKRMIKQGEQISKDIRS